MPGEGVGVRARVHLPQPHRMVWPISPTCDSFSIGTERYAIDRLHMPGEGVGVCPRVYLPQPHRPVITPSCECFSVGTERYA